MSDWVRFFDEGARLEGLAVPEGFAGICTMCTITLDGILMRKGIPIQPVGGGLAGIVDRVPRRFTHMILYEATTIDPLEVLLPGAHLHRQGHERGERDHLANLRPCHMEAESLVSALDDFSDVGFTGILEVGAPNVPILGVSTGLPVIGVAMVGGTNPMAALKEESVTGW